MKFISKSAAETKEIAKNFAQKLITANVPVNKGALIVGLYGNLGSGKTTFVKYLAKNLGIKETIQSPTFVIMKRFSTSIKPFSKLIHIDAYRINKEEMINLGWEDIISNPNNLICIEWPEKIVEIIPSHLQIFFEYGSTKNERKIKILGI